MENTLGKVTLISPAKVGGKRLKPGATPLVTAAIALQLAEMGAIEANATEVEALRSALQVADEHAVESIAPIVDLMKGEKAGELKTDAGNWSAAKIGAALGRKVEPAEIQAAAKIVELTPE